MQTTRLPEDACPYCGRPLNGAADLIGQARPSPGDWSLCVECGAALVFDEALRLREPTDEEMQSVPPRIVEYAELLRRFKTRLRPQRR